MRMAVLSVLDSSAVLALLNQEPGANLIWPLVSEALISAVNAAEVQGKLVRLGIERTAAWQAVVGSVRDVVAFDDQQAEPAGNLLPLNEFIRFISGRSSVSGLGECPPTPCLHGRSGMERAADRHQNKRYR